MSNDESPHPGDDKAIGHLRAFLEAVGVDMHADPEIEATPGRVAELYRQLFSGLQAQTPTMSLFDVDESVTSPVLLLALPFKSMCVHHLVPILGRLDIAYVPDTTMAGFGSFSRLLDHVAARPQIQERIVWQLADIIEEQLAPAGLLIRCRARQMCVEMRGRRDGVFVTVEGRGCLESGERRREAMDQFIRAEVPL